MSRPGPDKVKTICCVGAGTIGGGWAAYFLARGFDVIATDPGPDAEAVTRRIVDDAWPALETLGLAPGADRARLRFAADVQRAVADADFIQESAPDDETLKIDLFEQIGAAARPDTVIASSSSKFVPSSLASRCAKPERCIIGHPFVPSYLIPLVEVVGGEQTADDVMQWSVDFYNGIGKTAMRLKKEIAGYVANRLQFAVFAEASKLVHQGICDYEDIDTAMTQGPGLRWAMAGPAVCYHLGGGKGGVRHMVDHFGWSGPGKAEDLIASVDRMVGEVDIDTLEQWRDDNLLMLMKNLKPLPGS